MKRAVFVMIVALGYFVMMQAIAFALDGEWIAAVEEIFAAAFALAYGAIGIHHLNSGGTRQYPLTRS